MKCPFAKYIVSINSLKLSCFLVLSYFGLNPRRIHFTKVMNLIWLSVNGIYSSASLFSRDLISNIFIPISVLWMSSPLNNIFWFILNYVFYQIFLSVPCIWITREYSKKLILPIWINFVLLKMKIVEIYILGFYNIEINLL